MIRQPIRQTLADAIATAHAALPPGTTLPPHVEHALGLVTLHFAAVDLSERPCPDCGAPYVVIEDENHEAFTAVLGCPSACPRNVGVTPGFIPTRRN